MQYFFIYSTFLGLIIFDVYIFYSLFSSKFGKTAPFVPTVGKQKRFIIEKASEYISSADKKLKIVDMGSGAGGMLKSLAKKHPNHEFVGIERDIFLYKYSILTSKNLKNLTFIKDDFFNYDLKKTDIIICFTMPQLINNLTEKFFQEAKGAILISHGEKFEKFQEICRSPKFKGWLREECFVYKISSTKDQLPLS